jgi:CRP/FNR family cyclic AMP-dependent transcriptional regulator
VESHRNCLVFSAVIQANLPALQKYTAERNIARGQTVYSLDDPADELYLIEEGRVKIVRLSAEGQQKILNIYQSGDFFGELCLCGEQQRAEQAVALDSVRLKCFQMKGLLKLLERKPEMILGLVQLFCARLGESYDQITALAFDNLPRRLAREILRLSRALEGAPGQDGDGQLTLNLTHEDLAHLVGTSREMVTTMMTQFRQRGVLNYTRGHIYVEPARLEQFLAETET